MDFFPKELSEHPRLLGSSVVGYLGSSYLMIIVKPKGQIISKCLFGVFNFFQKTNENT